jgi:hypothetical protein
MRHPLLTDLLKKEMTRKEFLGFTALTVASMFGIFGVVTELLSHAATPYASSEAESGDLAGTASKVSDSSASEGEAVIFGTASSIVPNVPANVMFGMFMAESNYTTSTIATTEALIGRKIDLFLDYQNWNNGTSTIPTIPSSVIDGIGTAGYQWTIQPSSGPNGATTANCVQWQNLIAGDYDTEIKAFADWINNNWGRTLYVRFAHEMNGSGWYDWQVGGSCGVTSAANYAAGFNHFASVLKANTSYAKLVWAVNVGYDNVASYYPSECDVMAMDGYNDVGSSTWLTDAQVFASTYSQVCACDPEKPVWIAEMACMEPDASWTYNGVTYPAQPQYSKATWVSTFLNSTDYPRLQASTWFNIEKEMNWTVNSSTTSTNAFYAAFVNSRNGAALS